MSSWPILLHADSLLDKLLFRTDETLVSSILCAIDEMCIICAILAPSITIIKLNE